MKNDLYLCNAKMRFFYWIRLLRGSPSEISACNSQLGGAVGVGTLSTTAHALMLLKSVPKGWVSFCWMG